MKCPNCRCEVGNQPICPYCGATVYLQETVWNQPDYARRNQPVNDSRTRRKSPELKELDRRIRNLETKINLCLTLICGCFALSILTLLMLAIR